MKKTYLNPTLDVVKISTVAGMLSTSSPENGFTNGGKGDLGGSVTSGNLGREDDFDWDD